MTVELLTEHHLEFLSLKGGCTGSSEPTLVKCHIVGNHMSQLLYSYHISFQSVFNGMHVIFIPYSLMKVDPASWMKMITKYKGESS